MKICDDALSQVHLGISGVLGTALAVSFKTAYLANTKIRQQVVVAPHEIVRDRHPLAKHLVGPFLDADVIAEGFGHLLNTIETLKQRCSNDRLRFLAKRTLQVTAHELVKFLIC